MRVILCNPGYQCFDCLFMVLVTPEMKNGRCTSIALECPNPNCEHYGKKFKFPESAILSLEEIPPHHWRDVATTAVTAHG